MGEVHDRVQAHGPLAAEGRLHACLHDARPESAAHRTAAAAPRALSVARSCGRRRNGDEGGGGDLGGWRSGGGVADG